MLFSNLQRLFQKDGYSLSQHSDDDEQSNEILEKSEPVSSKRRRRSITQRWLPICTTILISYSILITAFLLWNVHEWRETERGLVYTPARKAMTLHISPPISGYPNAYHDDPFFGDPSPSLDARWDEHLKYAMIRLSPQEFSHYNQSHGVLLNADDNSSEGYLATPTVYHDLHCIRYLHKTVYPGYYFPDDDEDDDGNTPEKKQEGRDAHTRHCLHNLFHAITCSGDMTMRTMRWHPKSLFPSPVDHEHECRDWKQIEGWAGSRHVGWGVLGGLVHPTRGRVFPGGGKKVWGGDE